MAENGISELATKELREKAKLVLAAAKRLAQGNARPYYDITQLPTQYDNDTVVDNPNLAEFTVTPGVIRAGVKKVTYTGYHSDDVAFTDTATATASTTANNFVIASIAENTTVLYTGYLLATYTGTWTFTITSDDASYLWIGNTAVSGYTTSNELAGASYLGPGTGTISLTAGEYYPIRLLYGNGPSGGSLNLTYAHTGQTATNDFTGKLFSPGISLVVGRPWVATDPTPFTFTEVIDTNGATITETNIGPLTIEARSTSFQVQPAVDGYIKVNGATVKTTTDGSRGHTLLVIDISGATIGSITTYDTFESAPGDGGDAGRNALKTALNAVASGNYIVLVSWDACSFDSGLRTALNTGYGTTLTTTWASTRYSHIVIGQKV